MRYVIPIFFFIALSESCAAQKSLTALRQNMAVMASMPGAWQVIANEIAPDGKKTALHGTYLISWALDSTYLRIEASLEEDFSHKRRGFECLITYNPDSTQFVFLYTSGISRIRAGKMEHRL